jgi:hypothetical protein
MRFETWPSGLDLGVLHAMFLAWPCEKNLTCRTRIARPAAAHFLGAKNGRGIGKMCAIAPSAVGVPKRLKTCQKK